MNQCKRSSDRIFTFALNAADHEQAKQFYEIVLDFVKDLSEGKTLNRGNFFNLYKPKKLDVIISNLWVYIQNSTLCDTNFYYT